MKHRFRVTYISPLRYPGSKRRLAPYVREILQHNGVRPNVLVEPFVGGASVALYFLQNRLVERAIIADADKLVSCFWQVVFSNPARLTDFVSTVKVNLRNFYAYKAVAKAAEDADPQQLAEACIFLNRTSFSGILADKVGPLGGRNQTSKYKISCRFNRKNLIERIEHLSQFARKVTVLPNGWQKTIDFAEHWATKRKRLNKLLFYLDPPFYNKADELYREYFTKEEHELLCRRLISLKHNWILSYDNAPEIERMYSKNGRVPMHVEVPYSINSGGRRLEKELIITPLFLPPAPSACKE